MTHTEAKLPIRTVGYAIDRILAHTNRHISDITNESQALQLLYAARDMGWIDLRTFAAWEIKAALRLKVPTL